MAQQGEIIVSAVIELLDAGEPATGAVKADGGGVVGLGSEQMLLVWLPAAAELVPTVGGESSLVATAGPLILA